MKFLAAGDFHGNEVVTRSLAERAEKENVDLVVLTGDMLEFNEYATNIIKPFIEKQKNVIFVAGNHEMPDVAESIAKHYHIADLQERSLMIGDVGFFGCGGANVFPNIISEDKLFYILKRGYENVKSAKKKVMVTHIPPAGGRAEKFSGLPGSEAVRRAIEEFHPDIHISGHFHDVEGLEDRIGDTAVYTVGKRGKVIEI